MRIIRVLVYEGTADAVSEALSRSLPTGIRHCRDYTLTVTTVYGGFFMRVRAVWTALFAEGGA